MTSHEGNYEDYLRRKETQASGIAPLSASHSQQDKKPVILSDRTLSKAKGREPKDLPLFFVNAAALTPPA